MFSIAISSSGKAPLPCIALDIEAALLYLRRISQLALLLVKIIQ
jgi:hypothetical protein